MTGRDRRLRDLLDAATGEPPHQVSAEAVRRRVTRRRGRECLAGAAAVAVIAVLVPLGIGAVGHAPGPAGRHRPPASPAVYVAYDISHGISRGTPAVIPISRAASQAGKPIKGADGAIDADGGQIAITPDGKTAYVLSRSSSKHTRSMVTPVSTATNTPGKPVYLPGLGGYGLIAITPDGKTAYLTTGYPRAVIPISTATNRAGKPIEIRNNNASSSQIVISPDGKTRMS